MLAQSQQILEEMFHQEAINNAEILDKTPPEFYLKMFFIIGGVIALTVLMRKVLKKKREKN